ncbi:hypothetical protein [Streptomyces sp. NPDC059009]|uniref:hypothetical protein n=1 Tax=Streptomyces sp. NPDC059009 TaxID=3346694 RepID=UPI0036CD3054
MSNSAKPSPRGKPKKKAPNHFKAGGAALIEGLIEGADTVAGRSFLGGGAVPTEPEVEVPAPSQDFEAKAAEVPSAESGEAAVPQQAREAKAPAAPAPASATAAEPEPALAEKPRPAPRTPRTRESRAARKTAAAPSSPAAPVVEPVPEAVPAVRSEGDSTGEESEEAVRRWAHDALHQSFAEAKIHSERWRSHGFRIEPEVLALLKERIKADRRSSGNAMLGQGHYLDAALRHVPHNVSEQIAMAQEFLDERMGFVEPGKQSTYRVGERTYALVSTLNQGLQEADYGRRGLYVVSAALERFLQALDAEGELLRPVRRGRTGSSAVE